MAFRNSLWLSQLRSLEHCAVLCWAAQHHSCLCRVTGGKRGQIFWELLKEVKAESESSSS